MTTFTTEYVDCWKCGGTGQYRHYGVCFACHGHKKVKSVTEHGDWRMEFDSYDARSFKVFDTKAALWQYVKTGPVHGFLEVSHKGQPVWQGYWYWSVNHVRVCLERYYEDDVAVSVLPGDVPDDVILPEDNRCCGWGIRHVLIESKPYTVGYHYGH
jgi:hypothetical protein